MAKSLQDFVHEALQHVDEISVHQVQAALANPEIMILDVREEDEFAEGHIPGAYNVPRGFLEVKADLEHKKRDPELADRTRKIVCYCGGGFRSALAAHTLQLMGFDHVESMEGGWSSWSEAGLPVQQTTETA
jgi:rhodanese-related sulfurtransferase